MHQELKDNWQKTLRQVAGIGYSELEFNNFYGDDRMAFKKFMKEIGLWSLSAQWGKRTRTTLFFIDETTDTDWFFTSEIGARKALRYIETPGVYHGCIPYKKGDKAWAT